jgi:hypothetical protein
MGRQLRTYLASSYYAKWLQQKEKKKKEEIRQKEAFSTLLDAIDAAQCWSILLTLLDAVDVLDAA